MTPKRVKVEVTAAHGDVFAEELVRGVLASGAFTDAFAATELELWPEVDRDAQSRYMNIEDEIIQKSLGAATKEAISRAFCIAAAEVLAREEAAAATMPHVEMVETVTREHAQEFARRYVKELGRDLMLRDATAQARLMEWPEDDEAGQERYRNIVDEILECVIGMTKDAAADAFFMAATVILARERGR